MSTVLTGMDSRGIYIGSSDPVRLLRFFPYRKIFCVPEKKCIVSKDNVLFMKYTVVLEPQEEGGFTVQCVEIPGAISQGETRKEALANIKEAIELVLEVQREELNKTSSALHREISKVEVADVA